MDLEKDIELRKDGVHRSVRSLTSGRVISQRLFIWKLRLLVASEGYHHILSKKKASDSLTETDKLLPIDTLGLVMINHGEQFGADSSFGMSFFFF